MHRRDVQPALALRPRSPEARPEGDMRGCVLVEQGVEVRAPRLADPRGRVDERNLAEPPAVAGRVALDVRSDEVAAFLGFGFEAYEASLGELPAQPFDALALERERERAGERPVRPCSVRARERLLRRHVRRDLHTRRGLLLSAEPARAGRQLHVELRPWTAKLERGKIEARQLRRPPRDRAHVIEPAARALAVLVG